MPEVRSECLHCAAPLSLYTGIQLPPESHCPHCDALQIQYVYPPARTATETAGELPPMDEGATCFFHGTSPAETICDDCGRFLCAHCTFDIPRPANDPPDAPSRLCPACLEHRLAEERERPRWDLFQTVYPRYDILAMLLAILPVVIFPLLVLTPFTVPITFYLLIRYWGANRTPLGRYYGAFIAALVWVGLTILIWIAILAPIFATILGAL